MTAAHSAATASVDYLLHLADNALVLGQRNAEWCGHGPILEEDIAMANISLDLIGQARLLYQAAATQLGNGATEDSTCAMRATGWCAWAMAHRCLKHGRNRHSST